MNEIENINYTNNQNYIQTNKDDINSFEQLEHKNCIKSEIDINNIDNKDNKDKDFIIDNNNYFNNNFNYFSPLNMASMYMMGGQNTFFDKLFMTLERANYQMFHLCEMIKLIKNQKPTLIFFKSLIISTFKTIKQKYYDIIQMIKEYFLNLKNIFTFNNDKYNEEDINNHLKIIDYIIKFLLGFLILIISFQII